MNGKGDKRRPQDISDEEMERRWERAFGKSKEPTHGDRFSGSTHEAATMYAATDGLCTA